jgi:outer membrane receptor protein involved in Fe transport
MTGRSRSRAWGSVFSGGLLVALSLVASNPLIAAPKSYRVAGIVHDQGGGAIPGAEVTLTSGPITRKRITDRAGRFNFARVRAESGSVVVMEFGFSHFEQAWSAHGGEVAPLNIVLIIGPNGSPTVIESPTGQQHRMSGIVRDQSGATVSGAEVTLRSGTFSATQVTSNEGRFEFADVPAGSGTVVVKAKGFADFEQKWTATGDQTVQLEIVLLPATLSERITVTATRTEVRLGDTPASVDVLSTEDLSTTAALTLDDELRQVPGFSLFRRSGSRTANPTSQGVSLRGVGASGPSRALVLEDGIPIVDPFGGWVYWDRVPRQSITGVELAEGGSSDLYGSDAMGGVINVRTRSVDVAHLSLETSYGNENTPDLSLSSSIALGKWGLGFSTEAFHTDGYILVPASIQGAIDDRAGVDYRSLDGTLERRISDRARVFVRGNYLGEHRQNGKVNEENHANLRQLAAGAEWQSAGAGSFSLRAYGGPELLDQNFYAVGALRATETLTDVQRVPVQDIGFSSQWSRTAGSFQTLVAGFEANAVRGSSNEIKFTGGSLKPSSAVGAGGRQQTFAVFGEDILRFGSKWIVTAGARFDDWQNYDALSTTQPLSKPGPPAIILFPNRTEQAFSPRLSVLRRLPHNVSLTGSVYRAFRAPTLNELYRSFLLGNVLTLSNNVLEAERLTGAEAGANWISAGQRVSARGVFFWSDISRPIENVTLSSTPSLITRERENLGRARARGVSFDLSENLTRTLVLTQGYEFTNSTVVSYPGNMALVGLRVPEVPRHDLTFQVRYSNLTANNRLARFTVGIQARAESATYDDDLNTLRLNPYFTMDAIVSRQLAHGTELFVATENLTNQRYQVALTPAANLGPPALVRVGLRFQLDRH